VSSRPVPLTDMPWALLLILVAVGLPRTVLADLDIVVPESSLLYYVLALAPFAAWLVVAVVRPTRKPVMDFLILGLLYELSLILVHQLLWNAPGAEHSIPEGAITFAEQFDSGIRELVLRLYTAAISLGIGIGTALVAAAIAAIATWIRRTRSRRAKQA